MKKPKISIIISSYNSCDALTSCLHALELQTLKPAEVIVVDAASTDATEKMVKQNYPWVKFVSNKKRIGIGAAINRGIKVATGDYICFDLNCDDLPEKAWLENLVNCLQSDKKIGIVCGKRYWGFREQDRRMARIDSLGGRMLLGIAVPYAHGSRDIGQFIDKREVGYASVILTKKSIIDEVGLVDEEFFIYGEDVEFSLRVKNAGYKIVLEPQAQLWHQRSGTVGESSAFRLYYLSRSRLRIIFNYYFGFKKFLYAISYAFGGLLIYPIYYSYLSRSFPFKYIFAHITGIWWSIKRKMKGID